MSYSQGEPNSEREDEARIADILLKFENGDSTTAIDALRVQVNELKSDSPEKAVKLAKAIEERAISLPDGPRAHVYNILGEAHLYASDYNKAKDAFQETAKTDLPKLPEKEKDITPEQRDAYSRTIHAQGRLADAAFHSGDYESASNQFEAQINTQESFPPEPVGPRACALYGKAASEFMKEEGDIANVLDILSTAKTLLQGVQGEDTLSDNINNLIAAAEAMNEVDREDQQNRRQHMHEAIKNQDGGKKGVKHINFAELHDTAVSEVEKTQEEEE
jgi:tetratricopeptide (TPR) repeat protein